MTSVVKSASLLQSLCKWTAGRTCSNLFQQQSRGLASESTPNEVRNEFERAQAWNRDVGPMTELVRDFLDPAAFYNSLVAHGMDFFCGVPDSLLKDFCAYVSQHSPQSNHVITANEGTAIALATGYHLATHKTAVVYLQNSGLGNTVNPLLSLAARQVYSVPMLLLVGWRGEPGKKDEPQHQLQGKITPSLLASIGLPFQTLPDYEEGAEETIKSAQHHMTSTGAPYCLLVKRQTFQPCKMVQNETLEFPLSREEALLAIVGSLSPRDIVVSTTGMLSRELYDYRSQSNQGHFRDFLTVGSMGHASSIALGVALQKQDRQVFCLDGDGAAIMHMGAMATIGHRGPDNYKHIVINNGAHDSVGGQPTDADNHSSFSFPMIARNCGYSEAWLAVNLEEIREGIDRLSQVKGPALMEVKVNRGARGDLGRPKTTPVQNKEDFMGFLREG